ncbi:MAG: hypothetical protein EGQ16_02070 [Clostridiales bacterium]|nr:hypothetical protein [Clostridiales bacterium]
MNEESCKKKTALFLLIDGGLIDGGRTFLTTFLFSKNVKREQSHYLTIKHNKLTPQRLFRNYVKYVPIFKQKK